MNRRITILVLGGTRDARMVIKQGLGKGVFSQLEHRIIYSVAGLVRQPELDCEIISGGFTQLGGLSAYLERESIDLVLDLTHPYAQTMSSTAQKVCAELDRLYLRFNREAWLPQTGDRWVSVQNWVELCSASQGARSVLLSVGQIDQVELDSLVHALSASDDFECTSNHISSAVFGQPQPQPKVIFRTAAPVRIDLDRDHSGIDLKWIKAIGPFRLEDERELMLREGIDLILTKNSGGASTRAKLETARELGIKVVMMTRPPKSFQGFTFDSVDECFAPIVKQLAALSSKSPE